MKQQSAKSLDRHKASTSSGYRTQQDADHKTDKLTLKSEENRLNSKKEVADIGASVFLENIFGGEVSLRVTAPLVGADGEVENGTIFVAVPTPQKESVGLSVILDRALYVAIAQFKKALEDEKFPYLRFATEFSDFSAEKGAMPAAMAAHASA